MSIISKFKSSSSQLKQIQPLCVCAMMLSLRVVLGIFTNFTLSIVPFVKIGFSFIPIVIVAIMYGPVCAAIVSGAGDIISTILANPTSFSIMPGITVCYIIEGCIYGIILYQNELKLKTIILAKISVLFCCSLPLNTLVLSLVMDFSYFTLLAYRCAVLIPFAIIEIAITFAISKFVTRFKKLTKQ